jgi:hypothetical protein
MDFVNHSPACLEAKARPSLEWHMAKAYLLARLSTVRPSKYTPQLASEQVPLAPRYLHAHARVRTPASDMACQHEKAQTHAVADNSACQMGIANHRACSMTEQKSIVGLKAGVALPQMQASGPGIGLDIESTTESSHVIGWAGKENGLCTDGAS